MWRNAWVAGMSCHYLGEKVPRWQLIELERGQTCWEISNFSSHGLIKLGQNVLKKLVVVVNWRTEVLRFISANKKRKLWMTQQVLPMKKLVEKSDWNVNRLLALHWNLSSRASSDSCFRNILQRHVQHTRRINPMQMQLSNLPKITYVPLHYAASENNWEFKSF